MSLQAKLDAFKAEFESGKPPYNVDRSVIEAMHRATAELITAGGADRALKTGDHAPAFDLPDQDGKPVRSADLLARGPLVISFYRGVWCPYCNTELQALRDFLPRIAAAGASLVAISPQTQPNSRKAQRQNSLTFPILSDQDSTVSKQFGLTFTIPDYLMDVYKKLGVDLPTFNADQRWLLPMPARYVIAPSGIITYANVNPDYTQRPEPEDMLVALNAGAIRAA